MKNIKTLLLAVIAGFAVTSCGLTGPGPDEAIAYNDGIINKQVAIIEKIDAIDVSFDDFIPEEMDAALQNALTETKDGIKYLENLEAFDGSTDFKDNAMKLFQAYLAVLENEFTKMIEIYKLPDEEYTEEDQERWGELYDASVDKMSKALDDFIKVQKKFAQKYNFVIANEK